MKKNLLMTAALVAAAMAQAQPASPPANAPAQAAGTTPSVAAPAVADANATKFVPANVVPAATSSGVTRANPFTGKYLTIEELQRELEARKLETQLLEEKLRHDALTADSANMTVRKQAEVSQAQTQITREEAQRAALARDARNLEAADLAAKDDAVRAKKEAAAARREAEKRAAAEEKRRAEEAALTRKPVAVETPTIPRIEVLGVTTVGARRSALLAINANIASVQDGDSTPLGKVSISDKGVVTLNGIPQAMQEATIARIKLSETAPVTPVTTTKIVGGAPTPTSTSAANTPNTLVIGSQPADTQPSVLPPPVPGATPAATNGARVNPVPQLQLPPGVSVVPATR